jgi:hypothetical protein
MNLRMLHQNLVSDDIDQVASEFASFQKKKQKLVEIENITKQSHQDLVS